MHIDRPVAVHLSKAEVGLLLDLLRRHGGHPASASAFAALNEALERLTPIAGIVSFSGHRGRSQHPVIDRPVTARFSKAEARLLLHLLRSLGGDPALPPPSPCSMGARSGEATRVAEKTVGFGGFAALAWRPRRVPFPLFRLQLILVVLVFMLAIWNRDEINKQHCELVDEPP